MAIETVADLKRKFWMQQLGGDPSLELYSNADLEYMYLNGEVNP